VDDLSDRVDRELLLAERFREEGRRGRARVCARRAAGWALAPLYRRITGGEPPPSVISLLRWYSAFADAPESLRQAAARLTTHVTHDHDLPHSEDPIDDARLLIEAIDAPRGRGAA
jgi:hypothetical protein